MNLFRRREAGFAIGQMLVVVAILAVLSSIVLVSVGEARKSARDKQRIVMLDQMALALRLYKEANGTYPAMGCSKTYANNVWVGPGPGNGGSTWYFQCDTGYISSLVPNYISELPLDPKSENVNDTGFIYRVTADLKEYKLILLYAVEKGNITSGQDHSRCDASCGSTAPCNAQASYAVYSNTANVKCW